MEQPERKRLWMGIACLFTRTKNYIGAINVESPTFDVAGYKTRGCPDPNTIHNDRGRYYKKSGAKSKSSHLLR